MLPDPKLQQRIADAFRTDAIQLTPLHGDGSTRSFLRLQFAHPDKPSLIVMRLTGQDRANLADDRYDWLGIAKTIRSAGISVPEVVAVFPELGAIITEDCGDEMLQTYVVQGLQKGLAKGKIYTPYLQSFKIIGQFLNIDKSPEALWCTRRFDADQFARELAFFRTHFLAESMTPKFLEPSQWAALEQDSGTLANYLSSLPQYFVHRDFHSRNIMREGQRLAVIDFQDARLGPAAYDFVSLCFDAYVPLTTPDRISLIEKGLQSLPLHSKLSDEIASTWRPVLLQRQLKALGSFAYLTAQGRGNYLPFVKPALAVLAETLLYDSRWPFISGEFIQMLKHIHDGAAEICH